MPQSRLDDHPFSSARGITAWRSARAGCRLTVGLSTATALIFASGCGAGTHPAALHPDVVARANAPVKTCAALAGSLSTSQQIGQLMMVGISSSALTTSQSRVIAKGHVGSVILLGTSWAGKTSIKALSKKVHAVGGKPSGIAVMLTVDQEGGTVQRLRGSGFDRIPSARSQALLSSSVLTTKSARWAKQLRAAGIDANLAPVADVVPKDMEQINQPIGVLKRGYGPNPDVVASRVSAFVRGMHQGRISTAVKHFPGLGRVRGNTDVTTHVVDETTKRHDKALKGFAAGSTAGVDMVMVSSAYYSRIDPDHRAAFSTKIISTLLRGDQHFTGVVISDDLAAAAMRDLAPGERAIRFVAAGGDLIIVGDPALAPAMAEALEREAKQSKAFRSRIEASVVRVLTMKARHGLAPC